MGDKRNPRYNQSGCSDPTAYEALKPIIKNEKKLERRVNETIKVVKSIINLSGFELVGRIQIRDKKTGKEFK